MQLVLLMELCETTLLSHITGDAAKNPGKLASNFAEYKESLRLVRGSIMQISNALAYIHERALVHRDLKPENILVCALVVISIMINVFHISIWIFTFSFSLVQTIN